MAKRGKIEIISRAKVDFYGQIEYLAGHDSSIETLSNFVDEMEAGTGAIATQPLAAIGHRDRRLQ